MVQVTVRYGLDQHSVSIPLESRFGDLVHNSELRAALGYGDNIKLLVNGVEMPMDAKVPTGSYVTAETAANSKA